RRVAAPQIVRIRTGFYEIDGQFEMSVLDSHEQGRHARLWPAWSPAFWLQGSVHINACLQERLDYFGVTLADREKERRKTAIERF
ncbi:hypothetical protein NP569_26170, partial [Vibrio parahaemolyticus]|nr:hypothetical protein [Vibrio parahaemolyticus]